MPEPIQEILPRVYRCGFVLNGRPVYQYLLVGEEHTLLVDTGVATTPQQVILPALKHLGIPGERVRFAVVTHCDLDHQGGARHLKTALPATLLTCGELDRRLVEDPQVLFQERYNAYAAEHGIACDENMRRWMLEQAGEPQALDMTWTNGESIRLDDSWRVSILQVPGHSFGHLSVYDPKNKAIFCGDAVQHLGYRDVQGNMAMPPTYLEVESYLHTVRQMELLELEALAGAHWPLAQGKNVKEFLTETRRYVEMADRATRSAIHNAPHGITLRELMEVLNPQLGDWSRAAGVDLVYSLAGHVRALCDLGLIRVDRSSTPLRYTWVQS